MQFSVKIVIKHFIPRNDFVEGGDDLDTKEWRLRHNCHDFLPCSILLAPLPPSDGTPSDTLIFVCNRLKKEKTESFEYLGWFGGMGVCYFCSYLVSFCCCISTIVRSLRYCWLLSVQVCSHYFLFAPNQILLCIALQTVLHPSQMASFVSIDIACVTYQFI